MLINQLEILDNNVQSITLEETPRPIDKKLIINFLSLDVLDSCYNVIADSKENKFTVSFQNQTIIFYSKEFYRYTENDKCNLVFFISKEEN